MLSFNKFYNKFNKKIFFSINFRNISNNGAKIIYDELIKNNFPLKVLNAYDALVPKAFRADLFRYCALYILGGCYVDHKIVARRPFRSVINDNDKLLVTHDVGTFYGFKTTLFNGFMCSKIGDSRIKKLIYDVVNTIEKRSYGLTLIGHGDLTITGPMVS